MVPFPSSSKNQEDPKELARIVIQEVRDALARGTKHFSKSGRSLNTVVEILECLSKEGEIVFQPAESVDLVVPSPESQDASLN